MTLDKITNIFALNASFQLRVGLPEIMRRADMCLMSTTSFK